MSMQALVLSQYKGPLVPTTMPIPEPARGELGFSARITPCMITTEVHDHQKPERVTYFD